MDNISNSNNSSKDVCSGRRRTRLCSSVRTRFLVVRHAEYVCPEKTRLSRKGSLQALAIAEKLRDKDIAAVYTSNRCLSTARTISRELNVKFIIDKRLSAIDRGLLLGLSTEQVRKLYPDVYKKRFEQRIPDYRVPEGESLNDRLGRVKSYLKDMVEKHQGRNIVVVTHGGVIDDIYRFTRSLPVQQLTGLQKPYGSISVLEHNSENNKWEEKEWVGVDHLPQVVGVAPTGGQLYLFPHQVAGSFPLLRGDLGELCKPATQNELEVYEAMRQNPNRISDFTPLYLGLLTINVNQILQKLTTLNKPFEKMMDMPCESRRRSPNLEPVREENHDETTVDDEPCKIKRRRHSIKEDKNEDVFVKEGINQESKESSTSVEDNSGDTDNELLPQGKHPWSVTNLWDKFKQCRSMKVVRKGNGDFVYLILENLTHGMNCPHILDLKVGTQQHGSFESEEKKRSKMKKCKTTTSSSLGIRVAGMQTFDESQEQYVLRDKYWGRSLNDSGVEMALTVFVTDNLNGLRVDVIRSILAQVRALTEAVQSSKWRFYGCSVLLVYDAKPRKQRKDSFTSNSSEDVDAQDDAFPVDVCPELTKKRRARSQSFDEIAEEFQVTVRLIDFAKTEMTPDNETYDQGFVFGLQNLKEILTKLLNKAIKQVSDDEASSSHPVLETEKLFHKSEVSSCCSVNVESQNKQKVENNQILV